MKRWVPVAALLLSSANHPFTGAAPPAPAPAVDEIAARGNELARPVATAAKLCDRWAEQRPEAGGDGVILGLASARAPADFVETAVSLAASGAEVAGRPARARASAPAASLTAREISPRCGLCSTPLPTRNHARPSRGR